MTAVSAFIFIVEYLRPLAVQVVVYIFDPAACIYDLENEENHGIEYKT